MKIGGFEISGKKVLAGIGLFTAGTIAAVMGKSKLNDSVTKAEEKAEEENGEIDDNEIVELEAATEETSEPEEIEAEEVTE